MINNIPKKKGFTLIELLITIAIAAIVMAFGVPSFRAMITNNRTITTANTLVAALSFAKSEAVKRGESISVGRVGGAEKDWKGGWAVFIDDGGTASLYDVGDNLLKIYNAIPTGYTLTTGNTFKNLVTYQSTGLILGNAGDTFKLCDSDGDESKAREIKLNTVGRVYTKTGTTANTCP